MWLAILYCQLWSWPQPTVSKDKDKSCSAWFKSWLFFRSGPAWEGPGSWHENSPPDPPSRVQLVWGWPGEVWRAMGWCSALPPWPDPFHSHKQRQPCWAGDSDWGQPQPGLGTMVRAEKYCPEQGEGSRLLTALSINVFLHSSPCMCPCGVELRPGQACPSSQTLSRCSGEGTPGLAPQRPLDNNQKAC